MRSISPAQTQAIGRLLAEKLQAGDVLLMLGDLGAGKSELTRGIAKGLGVTATVASPSPHPRATRTTRPGGRCGGA